MSSLPLPVVVRQVWQSNLAEEFSLIQLCAGTKYRFISIDTEFPGTVFHHDVPKHAISSLSLAEHYRLMKKNVDALNIIQLGLTLSDGHGNLPHFGSGFQYVWEFNFRDFDADEDLCNPASISLLRSQGIDFSENKRRGIDSRDFARCFLKSWLGPRYPGRFWVTFHGLYDFGFLVKALQPLLVGKAALPDDLRDFMKLVRFFLGRWVYDLKPIAHAFDQKGGLEKVAKSLGLGRAAGKNHQAGSDSLLTMHAFLRLSMRNPRIRVLERYNYKLYGLTCKF